MRNLFPAACYKIMDIITLVILQTLFMSAHHDTIFATSHTGNDCRAKGFICRMTKMLIRRDQGLNAGNERSQHWYRKQMGCEGIITCSGAIGIHRMMNGKDDVVTRI